MISKRFIFLMLLFALTSFFSVQGYTQEESHPPAVEMSVATTTGKTYTDIYKVNGDDWSQMMQDLDGRYKEWKEKRPEESPLHQST